VAIVIPDHDGRSVQMFTKGLKAAHWKVTSREVSYSNIGNTIANSCSVITAVHSSCVSNVDSIILKTLPRTTPWPISTFIWEPFDRTEHSLCYGQDNFDFNKDETSKMITSTPKTAVSTDSSLVNIRYHLHHDNANGSILAGSSVLSGDSLCPPFEACPNQNLFQQYYSLEFHHDGHTYVCAILTFGFTCCFNLVDKLQHRLLHKKYKYGLDASMATKTLAWIFEQVHSHLVHLHNSNSAVFLPNQFAALAATIQTLVNGAVCTCLPSRERWLQAYNNDIELCAVQELILNPFMINNQALAKVNHNYHRPLPKSLISVENDMLIMKEPIGGTSSYTRLQLVPLKLSNILFIVFHTNAMGGHLNAYQTLHRI
jgi:hypothetical protein